MRICCRAMRFSFRRSGRTISIAGEVQRPAIYEIRGESAVEDAIQMAGGLTPQGDPGRVSLTSVDAQSRRVVSDVVLAPGSAPCAELRNGDVLRVSRLRPTLDSGVTLAGAVFRPGTVAWRQGMRLTDVIGSIDELQPNADQNYLVIRRETPPNRRIAVVSGGPRGRARGARRSSDPSAAAPRPDQRVRSGAGSRACDQADHGRAANCSPRSTARREVVRVEGRVHVPGEYPLEAGNEGQRPAARGRQPPGRRLRSERPSSRDIPW